MQISEFSTLDILDFDLVHCKKRPFDKTMTEEQELVNDRLRILPTVIPREFDDNETENDTKENEFLSVDTIQQQRLLLLRHSSKCPHDDGCCPDTPYCGTMKILWGHIICCKENPSCDFVHCVSSRLLLKHYANCKLKSCCTCTPVREAVKNSYLMSLVKKRRLLEHCIG
jgi:hypothetical protein